MEGHEIRALIGRRTRFEGDVVFEGRVRVDGALRGTLKGEGIVVFGEGCDVDATIEASTVIIRGGVVRGEVRATELIEVHAEAKVVGTIRAKVIDLAKGCAFEGTCSMIPSEGSPESR